MPFCSRDMPSGLEGGDPSSSSSSSSQSQSTASTGTPKTHLEEVTPEASEHGSEGDILSHREEHTVGGREGGGAGHETTSDSGRLRLFGPLPSSQQQQATVPTSAEAGSTMLAIAEEPEPHRGDASSHEDEHQSLPVWEQIRAFEQQHEQQLAHEQAERWRIQVAADEAGQLLEHSKRKCADLQQEVNEQSQEVANQMRTIEQLTLRFQELEESSARERNAQAKMQTKSAELSRTLALTQQRLNESEESRKTLVARLEESERSRQADLARHSREKEMQTTAQRQLDEQTAQHEMALASVWQQCAGLQAQLTQKEAEHCQSQQAAEELKAELERAGADYKKAMANIAQALNQPFAESLAQ